MNNYRIISKPSASSKYTKTAKTKPSYPKANDSYDSRPYAPWYETADNYPILIMRLLSKNPQLARTINWKANAVISGGLVFGKLQVIDNQEILVPEENATIREWLKGFNYKRFFREISKEFFSFWNGFPELILSKDRKLIVGLKSNESAWCRYGKQNSENKIDMCYVSTKFGIDPISLDDKEYVSAMPVIYPYWMPQEQVYEGSQSKFVYPVAGTCSGFSYYALQEPLEALINSGWLEVSQDIPIFKKAMMSNQMTPKYMVTMPDWWMPAKYKDQWEQFSTQQRIDKQDEEFDNFENFLAGAENTGKSIQVTGRTNPQTGEMYEGWKIELIENRLLDSAYNEDSEIAGSYISNALGVHGSLVGTTPGKSGLGSKGSEIRNLFNIFMSNSKPEQDILLEPLEFAYDYNVKYGGFPEGYSFQFKNYWLTTLDQVNPQNRNFGANE